MLYLFILNLQGNFDHDQPKLEQGEYVTLINNIFLMTIVGHPFYPIFSLSSYSLSLHVSHSTE